MKVTNLLYLIFTLIILGLIVKKAMKTHCKNYNLDDIVKLDYKLKFKNEVKTIIIEKRNGNYKKALNILDKLEEKDGISVATVGMRAKIYSCQQRFNKAIKLYKVIHEYYIKNYGELDIATEQSLYYLQNRNELADEEFSDFLRGISGNENYKLSKNK